MTEPTAPPPALLRHIRSDDLPVMWRWIYGDPNPEWKRWDAPYWPLSFVPEALFIEQALARVDGSWRTIELGGAPRGIVTRHWEDEPAGWLEVGIVIYDPAWWSGGHGSAALREWTGRCFEETPAHTVTLSTWGGNERMVRAARRVGYAECARVREARLWDGRRWDSVRMQVLREDWAG